MESWSDLLLAVLFYRLVALSDLLWTLIEYILVTLFGLLAWARRVGARRVRGRPAVRGFAQGREQADGRGVGGRSSHTAVLILTNLACSR